MFVIWMCGAADSWAQSELRQSGICLLNHRSCFAMYVIKLKAVNSSLFTALSLQTYFDRRSLYCNYFFLPLYSSETVNLARPFARRAANTRRPFFVAILSRKPCLFFLFLLEGWNVLFIVLYILYCLFCLFRLFAFQLAKLLFFFILAKFLRGIFAFLSLCLEGCF